MNSPVKFPSNRNIDILLVEDDDDHALIVERTLEKGDLPYKIARAKGGQVALDWLLSGKSTPDLILLDLSMPKIDGLEVLETIKANPILKNYPVVILSTSLLSKDRLTAYRNDINNYLTKPFKFIEFKSVFKNRGSKCSIKVTRGPSDETTKIQNLTY